MQNTLCLPFEPAELWLVAVRYPAQPRGKRNAADCRVPYRLTRQLFVVAPKRAAKLKCLYANLLVWNAY